MSSNQIAPPRLPEPTREYSQVYMQDLLRALEIFIEQERNPGEMRGTKDNPDGASYKCHGQSSPVRCTMIPAPSKLYPSTNELY